MALPLPLTASKICGVHALYEVKIEEKRHSRRLLCNLETRSEVLSALEPVQDPQFLVQGLAENISAGGIGMVAEKVVSAESLVRVEFVVPESNFAIPSLLKVQWCDNIPGSTKYKVGLKFML
jgi:hypothetical protein